MTLDAKLLPCPFCGAGETQIHENGYWTGMRTQISSVEVRHWCERKGDELSPPMISRKGKTREEAIEAWNRRAPATKEDKNV